MSVDEEIQWNWMQAFSQFAIERVEGVIELSGREQEAIAALYAFGMSPGDSCEVHYSTKH